MKYLKPICVIFLVFVGMLSAIYAQAEESDLIVGSASTTMKAVIEPCAMAEESVLGDYIADAVRDVLDTDIAIINGGDFNANLCGGEITHEDIAFLFTEDYQLAVLELTPAQLKELLELGVSHLVLNEKEVIDHDASEYGGFPQVSGIELCVDVSAPIGERILSIKMEGVEIDLTDNVTVLRLAATEHMLSGGYNYPVIGSYTVSNYSLIAATEEYIARNDGIINAPDSNRMQILGTDEQWLFEYIPPFALVLLAIFLVVSRPYQKGIKMSERPSRDTDD